MSYQVLARKYRPSKFEDVVGQEHIVKSLQNSLLQNRLGHAYIFSGTRGIGKTSVARIFAKAIRCENLSSDGNACGECAACKEFNVNSSMNVIEIDGASNNGVDDIRDLISNIQYLPTTGKYKVYIIDEVHMLSTPAFNALLKTLEEPPEHAIFILATTEPHKLLGTVLSRCQRFDFRNASTVDLSKHIKRISEQEGITFENDNLVSELASLGNGSFRDTLSLLDQVLSFSDGKHIVEEVFAQSLGVAKTSAIKTLIHGIVAADIDKVSNSYRKMLSENVSVLNITKSVLETVFGLIISKDVNDYQRVATKIERSYYDEITRPELYWIYEIFSQDFQWALESMMPEDAVEVVLRKISLRNELLHEVSVEGKRGPGKPEEVVFNPSEEQVPHVEEDAINLEDAASSSMTLSEIMQEQQEMSQVEEVQSAPVAQEVLGSDPVVEIQEVVQEESKHEKTWEGFLEFLAEVSPAAASNLEQGNLTKPLSYTADSVLVSLGFPQSAKVFYDYLNDQDSYEKLKANLSKFFAVALGNVYLELHLVDKQKADETHFESKFEIKLKEEESERQHKKSEIKSDNIIKHAQDIFGSSVDKIILHEDK
jgi:DNA polymerase-3 subunit gamma/tau